MTPQDEVPVHQTHLDAIFGQFEEKDPVTEFPEFQDEVVAAEQAGILSNVREERIMARRARIERRLLRSQAKHDRAEEEGQDEASDVDKTPYHEPVLESLKTLHKTYWKNDRTLQGYVNGMRRRRVYRQKVVNDHIRGLDRRLTEHRSFMQSTLDTKMRKYGELTDQTLSVDELAMLLEKYTKYGREFIGAKQLFVEEIEDEVKCLDDNFSRMLRSFQKDVDSIRKRATDMITRLTDTYRREIRELDKTFSDLETKHQNTLDTKRNTAHQQLKQRDNKIMQQREQFMESMLNNVNLLRSAKLDSYLEVKLVLESDVLTMTQQLQNMRSSFLVNAEKLDYNLEVLQLRAEESMKAKNKQKRIITKIQDELARTANEIRANERKVVSKLRRHKRDYIDLTDALVQLHEKHERTANKEWSVFRDSWISNELVLRDTLKALLSIDRFVTEEICSESWVCPDLWLIGHIGPIHGPRWRLQFARHLEDLSLNHSEKLSMDQHSKRQKFLWSLLNCKRRPMVYFRRLSLTRRPTSFNTSLAVQDEPDKYDSVENKTVSEPPPALIGPVLRWIVRHFDFLNEDYMIDVANSLSWQDAFCFQVHAFLDHFKELNYDDLCQLTVFFLKYSRRAYDQPDGQQVTDQALSQLFDSLSTGDIMHERVSFHDALSAVSTFMKLRAAKNPAVETIDLIKSGGRGRDASADPEYLQQYLRVLNLDEKEVHWRRLLAQMQHETAVSDEKLALRSRAVRLKDQNDKLKGILKSSISCREDDLLVYPPFWNKVDEVTNEICRSTSLRTTSRPRSRLALRAK